MAFLSLFVEILFYFFSFTWVLFIKEFCESQDDCVLWQDAWVVEYERTFGGWSYFYFCDGGNVPC